MQIIYYTLIIYLILFGLMYSFFENDKQKLKKTNKGDMGVILLLCFALLARLALANSIEGHKTDIACFKQWADRLATGGMQNFYSPDYFADYPPLYMIVLYVIGKLKILFDLTYNSSAFTLLIKLPAILSDIAIAAMLYFVGKNEIGNKAANALCIIFVFSPLILLNSTFWGQIDSVFALVLILSFVMLYKEKYYWAAFLYVLCALIKPQAFIVAPVYLCAYFKTKDYKMIAKCILIGVLTMFAFALPFTRNFDFLWLFEKYKNTLASYPYATVNAYNMYALFDYNWKDITSKFLFLPISFWSNFVILLTTVGSIFFYVKSKEKSKIFYMGYLIITTIFTIGAKMHERYLFPAIILLAFAYLYKKDKRILLLFIAQSVLHYLNVADVLVGNQTGVVSANTYSPLMLIVSLGHVILLFYSIYLANKIYISDKATIKVEEYKKEFIAFGKATRKDCLIIAAITIIYSVISFINLGDTKAPQTFYYTGGNEILIDLQSQQNVESILMYLGIGDSKNVYKIMESVDGQNWQEYSSQPHNSVFLWTRTGYAKTTRYFKISCDMPNMMIGEIGIMDSNNVPLAYSTLDTTINDEQSVVPKMPSYKNGTYFDEIYHPRTAYEILNKMPPYEVTHPPLGKLIISIGVSIFGMTPFGWRVMGNLAGIIMLPVFFLLCKKLFKNTTLSSIGTIIFAFDFMHFSQTRLATVDSFAVLFIMLMYYFVIDYLKIDFNNDPLKKGFVPLALTGIMFGIGAATKWICLYSALGLAVILVYAWIKAFVENVDGKTNAEFLSKFWKTILWCVLFFIVIPMGIYFASYLPQISYDLHGRTPIGYVLQNQKYMLNYHEGVKETHPYSSKWYEWGVVKKPLWAYMNSELKNIGTKTGVSNVSTISSFGNPAVWWIGLVSLIGVIYFGIRKKSSVAFLIIVGYLSQLIPWMFVSRVLFIYHYFACVPFLVLGIVYCMMALQTRYNISSRVLYSYCGIVVALFIMFYPVISGMEVPLNYIDILRWFKGWVFIN